MYSVVYFCKTHRIYGGFREYHLFSRVSLAKRAVFNRICTKTHCFFYSFIPALAGIRHSSKKNTGMLRHFYDITEANRPIRAAANVFL